MWWGCGGGSGLNGITPEGEARKEAGRKPRDVGDCHISGGIAMGEAGRSPPNDPEAIGVGGPRGIPRLS